MKLKGKLQAAHIKKIPEQTASPMPCALCPAPWALDLEPYAACPALAFARTRRRMRRRNPARGFTLLEILIALFIFAVLVTTIFGSFNTVFGNISAIEAHMDTYDMAQSCFNRIITDLQSLHVSQPPVYTPPDGDAEPDPYRFIGDITLVGDTEYSRLRFTSLAHVPLGKQRRSGIAEIIYYVEPEIDGSLVLRRSDILDPTAEAPEKIIKDPILCENILAFTLTYLDWDGEELETWDSDSEETDYASPRAVRIRMIMGMTDMPHPFETTIVLPQVRRNVIPES